MSVFSRKNTDGSYSAGVDYRDPDTRRRIRYVVARDSTRAKVVKKAEAEWSMIRANVLTGGAFADLTVRKSPTFEEWTRRYLTEFCQRNAPATRSQKIRQAEMLVGFFARKRRCRLNEITPLTVEAFIAWRSEMGHRRLVGRILRERTIDAELELLRHLWNVARSERLVRGDNPVEKQLLLKNRKDNGGRYTRGRRKPTILTEEAFQTFLIGCHDDDSHRHRPEETAPTADFALFSRYTGCRAGEALRLVPVDLDRAGRSLTFRETKNGDPRMIPVLPHVLAILDRQPAINGSFFGEPADLTGRYGYNRYRVAFQRVSEATGIDLTIHDLRHNASSQMQRQGASTLACEAVLGHKVPGMVGYYGHALRADLEDALMRLARPFPSENGVDTSWTHERAGQDGDLPVVCQKVADSSDLRIVGD